MHSKSKCLAIAGVLAAVLAGGCGGAVRVRPDEVFDLGPTRGERYAAALRQTLDAYEAELRVASRQTYPTFTEAYEVSRQFTEPDLRGTLEVRLEVLGLSMEGLNEYASRHPNWVREQNRIYRERIIALRGRAFHIMARYDRGSGSDAFPPDVEYTDQPQVEIAQGGR